MVEASVLIASLSRRRAQETVAPVAERAHFALRPRVGRVAGVRAGALGIAHRAGDGGVAS